MPKKYIHGYSSDNCIEIKMKENTSLKKNSDVNGTDSVTSLINFVYFLN